MTTRKGERCALPVEHDWEYAGTLADGMPGSVCRRCGMLTAGRPATAEAVYSGAMLAEAREGGGTVASIRDRFTRLRLASDREHAGAAS